MNIFLKLILRKKNISKYDNTSNEVGLARVPQNHISDKLTMLEIEAWCRQPMWSEIRARKYGITRAQWFKACQLNIRVSKLKNTSYFHRIRQREWPQWVNETCIWYIQMSFGRISFPGISIRVSWVQSNEMGHEPIRKWHSVLLHFIRERYTNSLSSHLMMLLLYAGRPFSMQSKLHTVNFMDTVRMRWKKCIFIYE